MPEDLGRGVPVGDSMLSGNSLPICSPLTHAQQYGQVDNWRAHGTVWVAGMEETSDHLLGGAQVVPRGRYFSFSHYGATVFLILGACSFVEQPFQSAAFWFVVSDGRFLSHQLVGFI